MNGAPKRYEATPETQPFWDAAAEGRLLVKRCGGCGEAHYPPRARCPFCSSSDTAWEQASGRGTVYTFSIMRRAKDGPYAVAYVELDEGPRVITNVLADDLDSIAIGDPVAIAFRPAEDGRALPYFKRAGD